MSTIEKAVIALFVSFGGIAGVVIVGLFIWMMIGVMGWYHYDYRCRDGVVEQQYQTMGRGWGGWNPVSNVNIPCEEVQ